MLWRTARAFAPFGASANIEFFLTIIGDFIACSARLLSIERCPSSIYITYFAHRALAESHCYFCIALTEFAILVWYAAQPFLTLLNLWRVDFIVVVERLNT